MQGEYESGRALTRDERIYSLERRIERLEGILIAKWESTHPVTKCPSGVAKGAVPSTISARPKMRGQGADR